MKARTAPFEGAPPLIYDLTLAELSNLITSWGEPAYRARQVWQGIYRNLWTSPYEFTNLPKGLRERLAEALRWEALTPVTSLSSQDNQTVKTLFRLGDGRQIETVLMKYGDVEASPGTAEERKKKRRTLCISTQVGCGMGCVFCATGQMGWKRNLSSGEIVAQVLYYARILHEAGERVTNIVVMGMGEPFHNYENTMAAIDRLNDAEGFAFGARRITISTVGLVPQIRRFADERLQVNLAVSLHAADDALRASLLPIARKYPLNEVLDACRYYTTRTHRRITFEWALIEGVNDMPEQARLLAQKVGGLLCHVNIIPLNPTRGYKGRGSTRRRAEMFRETLEQAGVPCTIRLRRGVEIQAGCGQLAAGEK